MPNGTNLLGDDSSTQSGIIVPNPYIPNIYYIFSVNTNDYYPENPLGIYYSIVDMTLNRGNHDIVNSMKNIPLPLNGVQKSFENITAIKHANGKDIWVITQYLNSFYAFKVDNIGVNQNPVISTVGIYINIDRYNRLGYLKASPVEKKPAIAHHTQALAIYDFDN